MIEAGEMFSLFGRGTRMEYEIEKSRSWQFMALLLTVVVVGGGIAYALTAA